MILTFFLVTSCLSSFLKVHECAYSTERCLPKSCFPYQISVKFQPNFLLFICLFFLIFIVNMKKAAAILSSPYTLN